MQSCLAWGSQQLRCKQKSWPSNSCTVESRASAHQASLVAEAAEAADQHVVGYRLPEHLHAQDICHELLCFLHSQRQRRATQRSWSACKSKPQETRTRSMSGCIKLTWSLHAMQLPSAESRSSMRWTMTSSGRLLRMCSSSAGQAVSLGQSQLPNS